MYIIIIVAKVMSVRDFRPYGVMFMVVYLWCDAQIRIIIAVTSYIWLKVVMIHFSSHSLQFLAVIIVTRESGHSSPR
jgi:hypothetical protein